MPSAPAAARRARRSVLLAGVAAAARSLIAAPAAPAALGSYARPSFTNETSTAGTAGNGYVLTGVQGAPGLTKAAAGVRGAYNDGAVTLEECAVGHTFTPWEPYEGYATELAGELGAALYPEPTATRSQVEASGVAFRYLALLYSTDPGQTDVTNHFQQMAEWFGMDERVLIAAVIDVTREALQVAPLDTGLRNLLLDCYTDRALAEVQFVKQDLEELGRKRLGLELVDDYIIDEEIALLESVTGKLKGAIDAYAELFTLKVEGVEPHDFDPSVPRGTPFGYYIFQKQQQGRNQVRSRYFEGDGVPSQPVPDYDEDTESVIPNPSNQILGQGYNDYVILLRIIGDYLEYAADLNRLRGLRQLPPGGTTLGDLETARQEIRDIVSKFPTDLALLRAMFAGVDFPPGDSSGVYGALVGIEAGLADVTNIRAFLSGATNILGLDPNFLILLQSQAPVILPGEVTPRYDSFAQIVARLRGSNRPLTVALDKMADARSEYENFRESVDQVTQELRDERIAFEIRFREITGYNPTDTPGFDGVRPKPGVGSELEQVNLVS